MTSFVDLIKNNKKSQEKIFDMHNMFNMEMPVKNQDIVVTESKIFEMQQSIEMVKGLIQNFYPDTDLITTSDDPEFFDDSYGESKQRGRSIVDTLYDRLEKLFHHLFKKLKYITQMIFLTNDREVNEHQNLSWQDKIRKEKIEKQNIELSARKVENGGIVISILKDFGKPTDISFTKEEIVQIKEISKVVSAQKFRETPEHAAKREKLETHNKSYGEFSQAVMEERSQSNAGSKQLWTDWKETGRQQQGDVITISYESVKSEMGKHQNVPAFTF